MGVANMKICLVILLLAIITSGCTASGHLLSSSLFSQNPATAKKISEPREVTFPLEKSQLPYPDTKQPESIAQFALGLAEKGEATKAAAFFLEAADTEGADSKWNRFRIACVAAAGALYLEAGEIQSFQKSVARLRGEMDRYQIAASEPEIALLLAISDKLTGRHTAVSPQIPWAVRELLEEPIQRVDRRRR